MHTVCHSYFTVLRGYYIVWREDTIFMFQWQEQYVRNTPLGPRKWWYGLYECFKFPINTFVHIMNVYIALLDNWRIYRSVNLHSHFLKGLLKNIVIDRIFSGSFVFQNKQVTHSWFSNCFIMIKTDVVFNKTFTQCLHYFFQHPRII